MHFSLSSNQFVGSLCCLLGKIKSILVNFFVNFLNILLFVSSSHATCSWTNSCACSTQIRIVKALRLTIHLAWAVLRLSYWLHWLPESTCCSTSIVWCGSVIANWRIWVNYSTHIVHQLYKCALTFSALVSPVLQVWNLDVICWTNVGLRFSYSFWKSHVYINSWRVEWKTPR